MSYIIGIGHKARQGKNRLAETIHAMSPKNTRIYSFAAGLKAYCRLMGWMEKKDAGVLQYVGTELFRKVDEEVHARCLMNQIDEENPEIALVPDMRFPNELERCDLSVRVRRLNQDGSVFTAGDRDANHPSETALDCAAFDLDYGILEGDEVGFEIAAHEVLAQALNHIRMRQKRAVVTSHPKVATIQEIIDSEKPTLAAEFCGSAEADTRRPTIQEIMDSERRWYLNYGQVMKQVTLKKGDEREDDSVEID